MLAITPDCFLGPDAYARIRVATRAQASAHRRLRSVALGPLLRLQFEDRYTVQRQIQELLYVGKVVDEQVVRHEIDAWAPLLPDGGDWRATLLVAPPEASADRRHWMQALAGVAGRVHVDIAGAGRCRATVDADLGRDAPALAAVHFLRFALSPAQRAAVRAGATVSVGCDHPQAAETVVLPPATTASLAGDLLR